MPTFSINWSHRWLTTCAKTKSGPGWHRDSAMPCCARIADTVGRGLQPSAEAKQLLPTSMQKIKILGTSALRLREGNSYNRSSKLFAYFHFARLDRAQSTRFCRFVRRNTFQPCIAERGSRRKAILPKLIMMSFGRIAFRRLPRSAMHGWKVLRRTNRQNLVDCARSSRAKWKYAKSFELRL